MDDVRFSTSLPRAEYELLVRRAREDDRSVASAARRVLLREFFVSAALGERGEATASRGAATADGAASPRSPSDGPLGERDVEQTVRGLTPGLAPVRPVPSRSPSDGLCSHGLPAGVCLRPGCKGGGS